MVDIAIACADLERLRGWVAQNLQIEATNAGNLWLPIVFTARGPLYAEAIALQADGEYYQPFHLSDRLRQPLYLLSFRLLDWLQAPPAVYLLQFALVEEFPLPIERSEKENGCENNLSSNLQIFFDCLIPFPSEPAIASVSVQEPNLFVCHWLCITNQPIRDLVIH